MAPPVAACAVAAGRSAMLVGVSLRRVRPPRARSRRRRLVESLVRSRLSSWPWASPVGGSSGDDQAAIAAGSRVHDRAVAGQQRRLDELVVPVDRERLVVLVDQGLDEGVEVARVERRGGGGEAARHVEMADDLHAVVGDRRLRRASTARNCRRARPRGRRSPSPASSTATMSRADQPRRRAAGDQRRGDDDVLLGDVRRRPARPAWPGSRPTSPWRSRRRSRPA